MFDAEITSVLPRHSTDFERALEQASLWVVQNSEIVDIWNPETCPPRFLPWLAWSVSVDEWDASWPDDRKRAVVRNSVAIHRLKGTRGAVRRALEAMGFASTVTEWFEDNSPVHTFRVDAFADDLIEEELPIGPELYDLVARQIGHVKPARSHFTLRIGERFRAAIHMRNGVRSRATFRDDHVPLVRPHEVETAVSIRVGIRRSAVHHQVHDCLRSGV